MYLLYCDETNLEEKPGHFFVYGGVALDDDAALRFSRQVDEFRLEFAVPSDFRLKFNPGPEGLSHKQFIELKQTVIELAVKEGATLFVSLILHDIATSPQEARLNEINRVCYHFDCFLARPDSHGLVLIDRFEDNQIDHHLRDKFAIGIRGLPYTPERRLERIIGFHYAAIGQSNLCSLVDIVLGSIRFAVNACILNREEHYNSSRAMLELISPMFFREAGKKSISEIGLFFSPKVIRSNKYRAQYEKLHGFFQDCGVLPEQVITGVRTY
jgi:hypothetical protein